MIAGYTLKTLFTTAANIDFYEDQPLYEYPVFRLTYINHGSGTYHFRESRMEVHGGDLLLIQPGFREITVPHTLGIVSLLFEAYMGKKTVGRIMEIPEAVHCSPTESISPSIQGGIKSLRMLMANADSSVHSDIILNMLISLVLHDTSIRSSNIPAAIKEAAMHMKLHPEEHVSMEEYAGRVHLSPSRFRQVFTSAYGISPKRFSIRERISCACQLMGLEGLSVAETARGLGYPDPFCFSRQFKRIMGYPPSEHRG